MPTNAPLILILMIASLFLGGGVFFVLTKKKKSCKGHDGSILSKESAIVELYETLQKEKKPTCVTYVSISLEHATTLFTDASAMKIYEGIGPILLRFFSEKNRCRAALTDKKNFLAVCQWSVEEAKEIVENCLAALNDYLVTMGARSTVAIHFGTFFEKENALPFDAAVTRARQASALAETEKSPYMEWNLSAGKALEMRMQMENTIKSRIDNNHFFLEYQPIIDAKSGNIVGAEALSRLDCPEDGIISPAVFLPAVSAVGLSHRFDFYVFDKNCRWLSNGAATHRSFMHTVNFSRTTLCDNKFVETLVKITSDAGLKPENLAVEILEDKILSPEQQEMLRKNLTALKEMGYPIFLDDFGSGYTSFDDLSSIPIDYIKIDRKITKNVNTSTGYTLFTNMVRTAKALGYQVLCEGIETEEEARIAKEVGCDLFQGFYFYRPMPVSRLEEIYREQTA